MLLDTERRITREGLGQISSGLLPAGTVLLSSRAPIGYLAISEVPTAVVLGLVTEWAALHREELREDWRLARQQAALRTIAPLE